MSLLAANALFPASSKCYERLIRDELMNCSFNGSIYDI